jgi:carbon storage regulator
MLVLTRRIGEVIVIDGGITVTVLSEKGGRIRLGITAPPSVEVRRQELLERARGVPTSTPGGGRAGTSGCAFTSQPGAGPAQPGWLTTSGAERTIG